MVKRFSRQLGLVLLLQCAALLTTLQVHATPFTETVPAPTSLALPPEYPAAGGVVIVLTGANGNVYYQFSDPTGAFRGFNNRGNPDRFEGNPFTVNDPIALDCGFSTCDDYFGGSIARIDIRFSAYDGDTQPGGFDQNDINLFINGFDVGSWSGLQTEITNNSGTRSLGFATGFGNNTFNTGWFASTNPALLNNILATGQTVSQVFDDDPNDNYWDFRRGPTLGNTDIETIAPGYELEKTARGGVSTYTQVGEQITFDYVVRNIGSVDIFDLAVFDDQIGAVTCSPTTIAAVPAGTPAPNESVCEAVYTITQEDIDTGSVTNIANATGRPEFGTLGPLTDQVTLTGPALVSTMTLEKEADVTAFTSEGQVITYTFTVTNTGNSTLSSVAVTDPFIPGLTCSAASIPPAVPPAAPSAANQLVCSGTYTVSQDDVDDFAINGTTLDNTATANAVDPNNAPVTATDTESLDGPAAAPAMTVEKVADTATYDAAGQTINYTITITNDGNVTWPAPPTITDDLTADEACPAGPVAPGGNVVCSASYQITLDDMDAGSVPNTVDAEITVGGVTAVGSDDATVTAVITQGLEIEKTLSSGPNPFSADTDVLVYAYELTNTGNTRITTFEVTDDKVDVSCPAVAVDPGDSVTCTSDPYSVSQLDLDAGSVTNTASATAQLPDGSTVTSEQTSLTINADQQPALTTSKTTDPDPIPPTAFFVGAEIEYVYTIANTGNVTITDPVTVTDDQIAGSIACPAGPIAPGGSVECRATYTVTGQDVAAGTVVNVASASDGTVTSNTDTVAIPQLGSPGLTLEKNAVTTGFAALTDTIDYVFTITNSGQTVIASTQPITIDDPLIGAPFSCPSEQPTNLFPGDSFDCPATLSGITQAQIDAGEVVNTATASFDVGGTTVTSPSATETVSSTVVPGVSLTKSALAADGGTQFDTLNEEIIYTFSVTNESAQTLASVTINDPLIPTLNCTITDLAPFATDDSCTGSYFVTQEDLDAGSILNSATANATTPDGGTVSDTDSTTVSINPAAATEILEVEKLASVTSFSAVGDVINYTIEVRNEGNLTLTNVAVTDPILGLSCTIGTLAPTDSDSTCFGSHTITQADIDAGSFFNEATATADNIAPVTDDVTVAGPIRNADFTVEKTANADTEVSVGSVVTYSHVVTNTGNVTLTNITLTDTHTSASGTTTLPFSPSNVIPELAPGESVTVTTSYTVGQDDIDAGADLTNTVSVTATPPAGVTPPTATDEEVVDLEDVAASVMIAKAELDGSGTFDNLPTSENFTFEVTNTGNVTLTGLTVSDPLLGFSCTLNDLAPGVSTSLCGNGTQLRGSYTLTQDDIDRGAVTNTVTVSNGTVTATDSVTLAGPEQLPVLRVEKASTGGANFAAIDDVITYDYVVFNDGNITLTAPITITDDKTTVSCPALPSGGLLPTQSITCTASYLVTQDDLDAGQVTNVAEANISQPVVPSLTYPDGVAAVTSPSDSETVSAAQSPAISISKAVAPGTSSTYSATSDVITFEFTVTNIGNVTITDAITVEDTDIGATLTCPAGGPVTVAPGDSVTCQATWSPSQQDIDDGSFTNSATAETTFEATPVVTSTPGTATVTAIQTPQMEVVKALTGLTNNTYATGETATYSYTITNPGNVTLDGPFTITDDRIPSVICPPGDIAPGGAALVCTGTYVITADDVELGSVTNLAVATDSNGVDSTPASETIPGAADPALAIEKVADVATFSAVGETITYTYTVTNTSPGSTVGGVLIRPSFENPVTVSDDRITGPIACDPTPDNRLGPDESTTCTAMYMVTQDDLDAVQGDGSGGLVSAFVTNVATANSVFGTTDVASPSDTVTVFGAPDPALEVVKTSSGPEPAEVDDVVTYTITTTNTGNQTMSNITVSDPLIPALTCEISGASATAPFTLAPDEAVVCTGTYTVTQDDVDAQSLTNTATAEGASPDGTIVTETGGDTHPLDPAGPAVTVLKELSAGTPIDPYSAPGQEVDFTVTVTNDGNVTLTSIDVTDDLVPGEVCTVGPLAPGESDSTCTFTYAVTQTDIDNGTFTNIAFADATPANPGADNVTGQDDLVVGGPDFEPSVSIAKSADLASFSDDQATITYTYIIGNTGNVTLEGPFTILDDKIATVTCDPLPASGLLPTETLSCQASYDVTQEDVDAGGVTNIATVTFPNDYTADGPITADDSVTVPSVRTPGLTVAKSADVAEEVAEGDTITYSYDVTNTGNVTLAPITLEDQHTSAAGTAPLSIDNGGVIATLAPGDSVTLSATYIVTQDDIDAGADLTNEVTATPTPPTGVSLAPVSDSETVGVEAADPSLEVLKTVPTIPALIEVGTVVTFEVTVENTGNVSLSGVTLADTLTRFDTTPILPNPVPAFQGGDAGAAGVLDVGETWVYAVSHTVTQEDIDAGGLSNSVLATATDPFGTEVEDLSDTGSGTGGTPTPLPIPELPGLTGLKTITSTTTEVDQTVVFEITVENTGNVTLSGVEVETDTLTRADGTPLTLTTDPSFVGSDAGSAEGTLRVDETATYRATYVLTQDDVDAGGVVNTATVAGTSPGGTETTDVTDNGAGDGNDPTALTILADPSFAMVKTLASGGPTFNAVDDPLVFEFEVTNTGNVTLTDPISITDPLIADQGGTITCDPVPLAPGDSLICSGTYLVTQDDLDVGSVTNAAFATDGTSPDSDPDSVTVPALQEPALTMTKVADPIASADFVVGAEANYTYTITNSGNVTITDPVSITDNRIDPEDIVCPAFPANGIAPNDTYVCTATYTVTIDDVQLGSVTNNATASDGTTTSPSVSETIPADGTPALTIVKSLLSVNGDAGVTTFAEVGDVLRYSFDVTNSGEVSFGNDVEVVDPLIAESPVLCFTSTPANPDLVPGESVTCEGTYTITQDDLDAGEVFNEASATTLFGTGPTPVESPVGSETTLADTAPALELVKSVETLPVTDVGQVLTYTLSITNTGNQTLSTIVGTDPLLPDLVCETATLARGETFECSDTYVVTQDDVDAGTIVNTAEASALNDQGEEATATDTLTTDGPTPDPSFVLTKSASSDPFGPVGSSLVYTFSVENTGNVTLFDVVIQDGIVDPAFTCTVAQLDVGATDTSCTLAYTVTQDDVDRGEISNTAQAEATDPFDTVVSIEDTIITDAPEAEPSLDAVKTADVGGTTPGAVVTYTLTVSNTGNVTLESPEITDTMSRLNGTSTELTTPFAFQSGDTDGDDRIDVDEVWVYTATYEIGQADVNAGGFENSVTVTADDPFGSPTTDVSDNGNDADGNTEDDATVVEIVQGPALNTVKTVVSGTPAVDETVTFEITATNVGNVTLTDPTITDTLLRTDGTVPNGTIEGPTLTSGNADGIDPGEAWVWSFAYTITQEDIDAGGLTNSATVEGTDPEGVVIDDRSDDGDDTDGNQDDDVTAFDLPRTPALEVIKTVVSFGDAAGETVVFDITATNDGNVTLTDLAVVDTLTNGDGTALDADSIVVVSGDAASVPVGGAVVFRVTYTLTQADLDSGSVENTATVSGSAPDGSVTSDVSDTGAGDGDTPTAVVLPQTDLITVTKSADTPTRIAPDLFEVTFTMTVSNDGNVTQTGLVLEDALAGFVAPATLAGVDIPVISGFETGSANVGYDGTNDIVLTSSDTSLAPGATGTVLLTVRYDVTNGQPQGVNVLSVSSDRIIDQVEASTGVTEGAAPDILASKSVAPDSALVGQVVTYTLTFTNRLPTAEANLTLVDELPPGLAYVPESATFNGGATPAATLVGRTLRWEDVTIDPDETVTLTLDARVVDGGLGELVNEAYVLDPSGARVSNVATATLRLPVEAVFDCTDIIGKVFDDRNMNGAQDGVIEDRGITDQTYDGGKFGEAPVLLEPDGEPGLPGVRLSTVDGTIITTDEYGRFSVPCAALPGDIGSNFVLKLDETSLPTGYAMTTSNPRVMRVTAGTMARMNFGATIATIVDIDLTDTAFVTGTDRPSDALVAGVDQLVAVLAAQPSVLRVNYYRGDEGADLARSRLDVLEALIRDRFGGQTGRTLPIERTINRLQ